MRTAKYHDYTLLRIVLFIILVILGLFIYNKFVKAPCEHTAASDAWVTVDATCTEDGYRYKTCTECGEQFDNQTIASTGHKPLEAVRENEKPHTKTEGGSYELVINCSECGEQISRDLVWVDGAHTPEIVETKENVKEATCTEQGSYDLVESCKGCGVEISRETRSVDPEHNFNVTETRVNEVAPTCTEQGNHELVYTCDGCGQELSRETVVTEPIGHDYGDFELVFDYQNDRVILNVVCNNDGSTSVITHRPQNAVNQRHIQPNTPQKRNKPSLQHQRQDQKQHQLADPNGFRRCKAEIVHHPQKESKAHQDRGSGQPLSFKIHVIAFNPMCHGAPPMFFPYYTLFFTG